MKPTTRTRHTRRNRVPAGRFLSVLLLFLVLAGTAAFPDLRNAQAAPPSGDAGVSAAAGDVRADKKTATVGAPTAAEKTTKTDAAVNSAAAAPGNAGVTTAATAASVAPVTTDGSVLDADVKGGGSVPRNPTLWLHESIRRSSPHEIDAALNAGAALTPECLWLAAIHTDGPTLDFLLKRLGANATDTYNLEVAGMENSSSDHVMIDLRRRLISLLAQGGRRDLDIVSDVSLLHFAALVGNTETGRYLLDQGVSPNAVMGNGGTPLTVAYSSWLRSWNPMRVSQVAVTSLSRKTNYPGFIYGLYDAGANPEPLEKTIERGKDTMERYVIGLVSEFMVPTTDGGFVKLGDLLDARSTNTAWGLMDMHLFEQTAPHYCQMTLLFLGRLKSDGSPFCIPFAFLDDRFVMPGDKAAIQRPNIWYNGRTCTPEESLRFMEGLGVNCSDAEFWSRLDASF